MIIIISLFCSILLHEFGHYFAAKISNVPVLVFSIGFGKPYIKKEIQKTEFRITPWLLGGFITLYKDSNYSIDKKAFINQPYLVKLFIVVAGAAMNLLFGIICYYIGIKTLSLFLYVFGYINIVLGILNLLPIVPCLDGGYLVFFPFFVNCFGNKKGIQLFKLWSEKSFKFVLLVNIILILLYIYFKIK